MERFVDQEQKAAGHRRTTEHRQHGAYEALVMAIESCAGDKAVYGPRMQEDLKRTASAWMRAGGQDPAYDCVTLAAQAAALAGAHPPSDRMAHLLKAVLRVMQAGTHPLRPVPEHIQRRDAAISGE